MIKSVFNKHILILFHVLGIVPGHRDMRTNVIHVFLRISTISSQIVAGTSVVKVEAISQSSSRESSQPRLPPGRQSYIKE